MDQMRKCWHFPAMRPQERPIRSWQLYGEETPFPDLLHLERIVDRARGHDWRIDTHRHLQLHQIFLFFSGHVEPVIEGAAWAVAAPCLLNLPRMTAHSFAFSAGTEGYVLTLAAADFPELLAADSPAFATLSLAFPAKPAPDLAADFAALEAAHAAPHPLRALRLRSLALRIGLAVAEAAGPGSPGRGGDDPRLLAFETLVRETLAEGPSLAQLAARLGLSERHLRRLCLGLTGQSAHALVETVRLREACRLLAYTRMQVQEVGYATGFDDPSYFARAFQRGMGLTPSAYRARLEGDARRP